MKRLFSFAILLVFFAYDGYSQEFDNNDHAYTAIKFAPASLWTGKITLGGEYNFKHRNSATFVAGIPFNKTQTLNIDGKPTDVHSKTFSLMGGFRHYFGKNTMSGFYVEPYLKYVKNKANAQLQVDLNGQNVIFDNTFDYSGVGVGAQLGVQMIVAKMVVFDLFLLGPEANSAKFSSTSIDITNNSAWDMADAEDAETTIKDVLNDIPVIGDKIEVKVDTNKRTVATSYSGFLPGFRIGASVGIRF